jgi:hypothetical protein
LIVGPSLTVHRITLDPPEHRNCLVSSRRLPLAGIMTVSALLVLGAAPAVSHAACSNPVACENALPGADLPRCARRRWPSGVR